MVFFPSVERIYNFVKLKLIAPVSHGLLGFLVLIGVGGGGGGVSLNFTLISGSAVLIEKKPKLGECPHFP